MESIDKIWQAYGENKDPELKNKLILEYASLVKYVAGRLSVQVGQHVDYDDLISYGIFGLIDAIDKFKYEKGVKFETYASLRIRGSIIDNIRKMDWVPRTLRQKNKILYQAYTELETQLGREPTEEELSIQLNMSLEETRDILSKASILSLVSLDEYLEQNHGTVFNFSSTTLTESPERKYEKKELKKILAEAIEKLNENEKKVIMLYYYEELTLKEISSVMGVSESRISQIHSKAVQRLQARLGRYKSVLFTS